MLQATENLDEAFSTKRTKKDKDKRGEKSVGSENLSGGQDGVCLG